MSVPHVPAFDSGLLAEDGSLVGCWLLDARDLLGPGHHVGEARDSVLWEVRRDGDRALVWRTRTKAAPRPGDPPTSRKADSVQHWLRLMARARRAVDAPDGSDVFAAGDAMVLRDLGSALDGIGPFMAALDPTAVRMALDGYLDREDPTGYALLDPFFDPGAPLARAIAMHPHWRLVLARVAQRHPTGLAAAVASGPDEVRTLIVRWLESSLYGGRQAAHVAVRLADDVETWSEKDRARLAAVTRGTKVRTLDPAFNLAFALTILPRDWEPVTVDGWLALAACGPAVEHVIGHAARGLAYVMLDARGDWPRYLSRLSAATGAGPDGLAGAMRDVGDMVAAYATQVLAAATRLAGDPEDRKLASGVVARRLLTDGRRLCRILDTSRRWHLARHRMVAAMTTGPVPGVPDAWPRAWPTWRRGDVDVRELTSTADLASEGVTGPDADGMPGLGHCVGGYAGSCLAGSSRVLSLRRVRDGTVERLSTAEVSLSDGSVLQHRGRGNREPPSDASAALAAYLEEVNEGGLTVDRSALAPVPGADGALARAGYDYAVPGAWERARDLWDPFVPRRLRGLSAERMVDVMRATDRGRWVPVAPPLPPARLP